MFSGQILYAEHNGTYVVKFLGDVRVPLCASLEGLIERMFGDARLASVLIDLTQTESIDSTALGLIAKIAVLLRSQKHEKPYLVSTNKDITRILLSMGFEQVFYIVEKGFDHKEPVQALSTDIPQDVTDQVIEAHRVLMSLNEQNKETFKNLVAALEQEKERTGISPCD